MKNKMSASLSTYVGLGKKIMLEMTYNGAASQKRLIGFSQFYEKDAINVLPFISVGGFPISPRLEVGIRFEDPQGKATERRWGVYHPQNLIQCWRAMKLLERAPVLTVNVLMNAWNSAEREDCGISSPNALPRAEMAKHFSDRKTFDSIRADILERVPADDELSKMLCLVRSQNIKLGDLSDIEKIIRTQKYILSQPLLEDIRERMLRNRREQDEKIVSLGHPQEEPILPRKEASPFWDQGLDCI